MIIMLYLHLYGMHIDYFSYHIVVSSYFFSFFVLFTVHTDKILVILKLLQLKCMCVKYSAHRFQLKLVACSP